MKKSARGTFAEGPSLPFISALVVSVRSCDGWAITSACSLSLPLLRLLGGTVLFGIAGSLSGITGHQVRILVEELGSQRSCSPPSSPPRMVLKSALLDFHKAA